ncbi:MAG: HNH endonuclease [bacterium]|nr:HNH endonuclease [bacterium]
METLVLNAAYQPVNRVSWQEAFRMVFTGRAEIVETYTDRVIRSAREVFPVPSIVRFVRKVTYVFRGGVKFNRKNLYLRDKGRCQYCGDRVPSNAFDFEHVIPKAQGGRTRWENIVVACIPCNQRKGNRTPSQAGMRLRSKPMRPRFLPGAGSASLIWSEGMPRTWRDYLHSVRYWHVALED